jgi:hypothetical protein
MKRLAVFLLAGIAAMAADAPIVNVIGVTEFEIPAIDLSKQGEIVPSVALVIANDIPEVKGVTPRIAVKLSSVSVGTAAHPEYGKAFTFEPFDGGKKGELRELKVKVNLDQIPDAQTYLVKVLLIPDGGTALTPQALDLRFTRPAATLSVSPLRLDNMRRFPVFGVDSLSPDQLKLQETSGRATITDVQIQVKESLKGPDDFPIAAQLQPPMISQIAAGKEATTTLAFSGSLPLGSTKGTLIVRSKQLAQTPPLEVAIEIVTRTSRFWLLAAIVVSIVMGYLFRTLPEKRRVENTSRLAAEQEFGAIKALKDKAVDPDNVIQPLDAILQALQDAMDAKPFVAATLDAAVKKAADDADKVMKDAETARAALRTRIKDLRVKLDSPDGQPTPIAKAVADRIARLEAQDRALKAGAVKSVETELDKIAGEIESDLPNTIEKWALELHSALERMGQWQGLDFEEVRKQLLDATDAPKVQAIDLVKTRELARELRIFVLGAGLPQVVDLGAQVLDRLQRLSLPGLKPKLDTVQAPLDAVRNLKDVTVDQVTEVAQKVGSLRAALIDGIGEAASIKSVARPEGLDEGDFAKAMAKLSEPPPVKELPLGGAAPPQQPVPAPIVATGFAMLLPAAAMAQSDASSWWDLQLDAPVNPVAGEPAVASVSVIGTSPGAVDIEWTIGNSVMHSGLGTLPFTPQSPGALAISVQGVARATAEVHSSSAVIQVRAPHGFAAAGQLADQLAKDERTQSIVSGFFIAAAGYAIFTGTWLGTFMDFLAAMLWGFSVDISAAKVREIAAPLLSRTVPFPPAK